MGDWSVEQVKQYRADAMKAGFDGMYVQGLGWSTVFEGKNIKGVRNQGTFDESNRTRYSVADVLQSIRLVIEAAKRKGHAPELADMGLAPEWLSRAAAKEGLIVEGFHHIIDRSAVRHILNRHGDAALEASRGQFPVTAADIELIPQIIEVNNFNPDHPDLFAGAGAGSRPPLSAPDSISGYRATRSSRGLSERLAESA